MGTVSEEPSLGHQAVTRVILRGVGGFSGLCEMATLMSKSKIVEIVDAIILINKKCRHVLHIV